MVAEFYKHISRKISIFCVVFIISFTGLVHAQESELNAHPALWLIEQGKSKTYILGSVHLLPPEIKWYGGLIEDAMNSADEVVFEVNMTPENQQAAGVISRNNGFLPEGDLLSNYLSEEDYVLVGKYASELGIPPAALVRFKPWLVSISLSVSAVQKEGWDQESGVDKHIKTLADSRGIKISELETLDAQLATLWDHPIETQAKMLKDTLAELGDISTVTMNMVGAWAEGDVKKMENVFLEPMMEQEDLFEALVVNRNKNWIPVIEGLISKEQTTLIVAGAAHFIGEQGVIELLKQKGINVKKVQ